MEQWYTEVDRQDEIEEAIDDVLHSHNASITGLSEEILIKDLYDRFGGTVSVQQLVHVVNKQASGEGLLIRLLAVNGPLALRSLIETIVKGLTDAQAGDSSRPVAINVLVWKIHKVANKDYWFEDVQEILDAVTIMVEAGLLISSPQLQIMPAPGLIYQATLPPSSLSSSSSPSSPMMAVMTDGTDTQGYKSKRQHDNNHYDNSRATKLVRSQAAGY